MASVFIVDNTDGTLSLVMQPGSLNGPGSNTRDSDLRIYGMGSLLWGEGMNENILRVAENFACEEKAGSPGVPQDETDIGPGKGITTPLIGQSWFNKSDDQLYFYNGTAWLKSSAVGVSATMPASAEVGNLWYDNSGTGGPCGTSNQLMVYNGTDWDSVADGYLPTCGGVLSGGIDMGGNSISNLAYPTASDHAANQQYVDDREVSILAVVSGHTSNFTLHLTTNQNAILDNLEASLAGHPAATMGVDLSKMKSFNAAYGGDDVSTVVGQRVRKNATDTLTAGNTIVLGKNPDSGTMQAATATWVETQIGATGTGGGDRIVKYWNSLSGSAIDGDIHTSGGKVYIRVAGAWEQVFPAQYS